MRLLSESCSSRFVAHAEDEDRISHAVSLHLPILTVPVLTDFGYLDEVECPMTEVNDGFDECKLLAFCLCSDLALLHTQRTAHPTLAHSPSSPRACRSRVAYRSGRQDRNRAHDPRQRASRAPRRHTTRQLAPGCGCRFVPLGYPIDLVHHLYYGMYPLRQFLGQRGTRHFGKYSTSIAP